MSPTGNILGKVLAPGSVRLGRLTTSPDHPNTSYHDPLLPRPTDTDMHFAHYTDFYETQTFTKQSRLRLGLAAALSLNFTVTSDNTATLAAPHVTTMDLDNVDKWWSDACSQEETQRWMELKRREGFSMYLIVGIRKARDATMTLGTSRNGGMGVLAVVPEVAFVQSGADVAGQRGTGRQRGMTAEGEQVFAVMYKKVRIRRMFGSSPRGETSLEHGFRWKSLAPPPSPFKQKPEFPRFRRPSIVQDEPKSPKPDSPVFTIPEPIQRCAERRYPVREPDVVGVEVDSEGPKVVGVIPEGPAISKGSYESTTEVYFEASLDDEWDIDSQSGSPLEEEGDW